MSQKVFEFAKELGIETIALMDKIREWNLPVKSHMASLDEDLQKTIREKLSGPEDDKSAAAVKKKAKKKVATKSSPTAAKKKTVAKKTAAKKTTTRKKKAATKKTVVVTRKKSGEELAATVTMKESEGSGETKVVARKKAVIRRKKAPSEEAAEQQAIAEELEASNSAEVLEGSAGLASDVDLSENSAGGAATQAPGDPAPKKRTNIIGRMDLSKARPASASGGVGAGAGASADRGSRPGGPTRNIRTGFYAVPDPGAEPIIDLERDRRKEKEKAKRPGAGGGREEEEPRFVSSDFRKREIIFQPKKKRVAVNRDFKKTQLTTPKASKRVVRVYGTMSVGELAQAMGQRAPAVIKKLVAAGEMASMNSTLDFDTISLIVPDFGFEAENVQRTPEEVIAMGAYGNLEAEAVRRPPVVTVMGHVDHGKTSLLDAIRDANVVKGEAGGITQHIGAYKVSLGQGQEVTFIDTPGHEAFTAMRERGARVTDIAIIVVAADDGVMPQTAEAINHAKAAGVPIIIAVNKIDKEGANIERIKQQLTEHEIVPEEWGGSHIFCPVSALKKEGIKEILEQILLVAEMEDIKANPDRSARGTVIEARVEKGRGPVASLLVKEGTLNIGDILVAGQAQAKVKAMMNDRGDRVKQAVPGDPVEVLGFDEAPQAGDGFDAMKDESVARELVDLRRHIFELANSGGEKGMTLESLFSKVKLGQVKELPIVLKADVSGSIEAVRGMLEKVNTEEVQVKIIHAAVGGISESDVLLASTSGGLIIGFNVRPDGVAAQKAKDKSVEIKTYSIVYKLVDDIKAAMAGLLSPDEVEKSMGRAEIREVFSVPKIGSIGGCAVVDGKIGRNDLARLLRDGIVVYEGKLGSLKRFKDDVKEVASGYECGIGIENFNDIKVGDVIETYVIEHIAREL